MQAARTFSATLCAALFCALFCGSPARGASVPALWSVQGAKAKVYIFGTIHIMKPDVVWSTPALDRALAESDDLWLEVPDDLQDPTALLPQLQSLAMDPAHPLSSKVTKADLERFDGLVKAAGLPGEQTFEAFRPWFAGLMVGLLPAMKSGYSGGSGIDATLRTKMKGAGKPVEGFETIDEQMHLFADLTPPQELAFFHESIASASSASGAGSVDKSGGVDALEAAWQSGDVARVAHLDDQLASVDPGLSAVLITNRNAKWAKRLDERLHGTGTSFVAVGMGHLAGPGSLLEDLEKLGYTITRVE